MHHDTQETRTQDLLSPPEFETRVNHVLNGATNGEAHARLILFGFGGLDDLVGDLGTEATRAALREVKTRIVSVLHEELYGAHLFGDRFAVLIPSEAPQADLTETILATLRPPLSFHGEDISLQPRFGVARAQSASSAQDLLRRATAALKRAEAIGGRGPTLYQTNQMPLYAADPRLSQELHTALDEGHIRPWMQPLWRLSDGQITGIEALARWIHPERGVIPPAVFLPLARRAGLLGRLDSTIRCQSLSWLSRIRRDHSAAKGLTVAVNVADADLVDQDLLEQLQDELGHYELPVSALHLELSERATTAQVPEVQGRIRRIAAAGFRWHLDDFGTGHSNIQRLRGLPFSAVKLDRSMIRGLGRDSHSEQLLKPMIALARVLDLEVVAEGVERVEQLQTLTRLGCDIAQGHHLSPPRPPEAIEELFSAGVTSPQEARADAQADARHGRSLR
jgi:EAL domain-containing protein (putative c-di-GMP-specific phosphodiesterase class I)/GGDEF domain-containing protein